MEAARNLATTALARCPPPTLPAGGSVPMAGGLAAPSFSHYHCKGIRQEPPALQKMENSKLIQLLRTFSRKELRDFHDFVQSPFFNKNEELARFNAYLKKHAPHFPPHRIERAYAYDKVFPGKPYEEKHLNYLMSFLLKLAERYIGLRQYERQEALGQYHILAACLDRDLGKHYHHNFRQMQTALEKYPHRNIRFYYDQYLLADIANRDFLKRQVHKYDPRLQQAADYFDNYFLANKLKYSCEMLNRNRTISADYKVAMLEPLLDHLDRHDYRHVPPIALYHCILLTLIREDDPRHFHRLKALLQQHFTRFALSEVKELYAYAFNYCVRKVNQGDSAFLSELFGLYKEALQRDVLMEGGWLSPWAYKNIVGVGLRLREFDWTENFIVNNNSRLNPDFRDNALNYNLAELHYYRNNYDAALDCLNRVTFSDVFYALETRKMMVKIFYERSEFDALQSLLASFSVYLKRNKHISAAHRQAYAHFIQIMQLLNKHDPDLAPKIRHKLANTRPLAERQWLEQMVEKG